jgi:hypothetical protein
MQSLANDKMELQAKVGALEGNLEQLLAVDAPASTRRAVDKVTRGVTPTVLHANCMRLSRLK